MNLSVAIGMDQDTVFRSVCATHRFGHNVVVMPACHLCERVGTDGTVAVVFFPQVEQGTSSSQGLFHLYAKALFTVDFPCGIVGITVSFHFGESGHRCCRGQAKPGLDGFSLVVFCRTEEAPTSIFQPSKVAVGDPPFAFLRVPPSCPSPQGFEDGRIDMNKGFLRRSMSVEVRPSSYFGVALCYQPGCCSLFVVLDDLSDAWKKRLHVFLRGAWKEVPLVLTDILSEKVKSVLKVRYAGLLFRKFQSSFLEKVRDEWCDCIFQHLFRDARDDEVIRITYQVYLLILALKCAPAGVWVLLSEYPFQAIQRHIGKDGRTDTALRRTLFRRIEGRFVHVSCFQPCAEDGFVHRDMGQQPVVADGVEGSNNFIPLSTTHW